MIGQRRIGDDERLLDALERRGQIQTRASLPRAGGVGAILRQTFRRAHRVLHLAHAPQRHGRRASVVATRHWHPFLIEIDPSLARRRVLHLRHVHLHADVLRHRPIRQFHRRDDEIIPKRRPILLIIQQPHAPSIAPLNRLSQLAHVVPIRRLSLQKSTIMPDHLVRAVLRHPQEPIARVHDRTILPRRVAHGERVIERRERPRDLGVQARRVRAALDRPRARHRRRLLATSPASSCASSCASPCASPRHRVTASRVAPSR